MKIVERFKTMEMDYEKTTIFVAILTLGLGALLLAIAYDSSLEIRKGAVGILAALVAAIVTMLILLIRWPRNSGDLAAWLIISYITIFFITSFAFTRVTTWEDYWVRVFPTEITTGEIFDWAIAASVAGAIIFIVSLVSTQILAPREIEKSQKMSIYITIGTMTAAMIALLFVIRGAEAEELQSSLEIAFWFYVIAIIPIELSLVRLPKNPQSGILLTFVISLIASVMIIFGFSSLEEMEETQSSIYYGSAGVVIAILIGIMISIVSVWVPKMRQPIEMRNIFKRIGILSLAAALVSLFIFAWTGTSPSDDLVKSGAWVAFGLSLLLFYLLVPFRDLIRSSLEYSKAEKVELLIKKSQSVWKQYRQNRLGMFALTVLLVVLFLSLFGPTLAPENPMEPKVPESYLPQKPSEKYWFGTDFEDKDVWSQFLWGARISLIVGILAGLLSAIIGTTVGILAGYFGRFSDEVLMRFTDFFLVIPWLPLMIVLIAILGRNFWVVIFVIGIVSWAPTARVVRAAVLSIKQKQYIERAKALGSGTGHIIGRHIFPNVFPIVVATTILLVAEAIFSEAFLDFFGLGDPNVVSWGWMLERAHSYNAMLNFWWWWILPPSVGIILLIMAFYLFGDTLDEILNPRLKRR